MGYRELAWSAADGPNHNNERLHMKIELLADKSIVQLIETKRPGRMKKDGHGK